jgi:parallel beta-helix repeat protein
MKLNPLQTIKVLAICSLVPLTTMPARAATINIACPGQTLQSGIDAANPGDTVSVTGACVENVIIRNEKVRFAIVGSGGASVTGASSSSPVFNVRGKGIGISNLTISGGSNVIWVNRGSNVVIDNNTIQNGSSRGILVTNNSFAVITNNTIQNNTLDGIQIADTANAHIGFNLGSDTSPSPNTITGNGDRGIQLSRGGTARIMSNTISNNASDGILVNRSSEADIASNTINGNGTAFNAANGDTDGNGINVSQNSSVQLGEDNPTTFFDQPNTTTVNNANTGIRCTLGGVVRGHLGNTNQINGTVSQFGGGSTVNTFSGTCPNSLSTP